MSNQEKTHDLIRQNEDTAKKSKKHEANLQKNSTIYFQVGLIVCLLATFGLLEMKFETTIPNYTGGLPPLDEPTLIDAPLIKNKIPELIKPVKEKSKKESQTFEEVPDETLDNALKKEFKKPKIDNPPLNPDTMPDLPDEPTDVNVPISIVEIVPIYPGCESAKDNTTRKKCMSEKISKLIKRKFEGSEIASNYSLTGKQKIDVQFKISKTGHVTDIKTRSPHPKLDQEAVRVIKFIPEMTPGRQRDKNVGVIYNLPIIFYAQ